MKKTLQTICAVTLSVALPVIANAQALSKITNADQLKNRLLSIGDVAIYILICLAVLFIVWNIVMSLIRGSEPEKKKEALNNVGWGLLGLAIIVSIWGLVNILTNTFYTDNSAPTNRFPSANFTGSM